MIDVIFASCSTVSGTADTLKLSRLELFFILLYVLSVTLIVLNASFDIWSSSSKLFLVLVLLIVETLDFGDGNSN